MKLSVIGAGAIGSMFGGLVKLRDPSVEVLFVARGAHGDAMRRQGHVVLEGPWGVEKAAVSVTSQIQDIAGSDVCLFTVKSQVTEETIRQAAPHLGSAVLVSIQNGINGRLLANYVPPARLVPGITATNMAILTPGRVSLQLNGTTLIGEMPDNDSTAPFEAAHLAAAVLRKSGLRIDVHPNVLGVQYNKLAVNALGYASVLSQSNFITEAILDRSWRTAVGLPILDECLEAYRRAAIRLAPIPGVPNVQRFRNVLRLLSRPLTGGALAFGARKLFNRKPIVFSLQQDLLRGKPTEIDFVNGEIMRLAREHGGDAPANALVVELVHELEQRGAGQFFSHDEVVQKFQSLRR